MFKAPRKKLKETLKEIEVEGDWVLQAERKKNDQLKCKQKTI